MDDRVPLNSSSDTSSSIGSEAVNTEGGQQEYEWRRYNPLIKATLRGDWKTAESFFQLDNSALTEPITQRKETALHIAVGVGKENIHFVKNLVELMPFEALAIKNLAGHTPLHLAALIGNTEAAAILVNKHSPLLYDLDEDKDMPIHFAALYGRRDTLMYLLCVTRDDQVAVQDNAAARFIEFCITSNYFDVALEWVQKYPREAVAVGSINPSLLIDMAFKSSAFQSGSQLNFWQRKIYPYVPVKLDKCSVKGQNNRDEVEITIQGTSCAHEDNRALSTAENISIFGHPVTQNLKAALWKFLEFSVPQIKHVRKEKLRHVQAHELLKTLCEKISQYDSDAHDTFAQAMTFATYRGVPEIVEEIVYRFPSLIWTQINKGHHLFQEAITGRHEKVFNLLYQMSDHRYVATVVRDDKKNTMLHCAGLLAPASKLNLVAGAALQMQRELQWFEEVKKFVHPRFIESTNKEEETPGMVFTREHKDLVEKGEKWMKDTANSCTIAAALIVTVVFAAAITVPGGNNDDTGLPVFSQKTAFIIFAVSDAFSLFTSATSLLMFLSILTSRYAEHDFLHILPKRLIIGLFTLFLSITAMMVAFSSTLYLVFGHNKAWILIPVAALTCLPITSFVTLQFPLLVSLISSTYGKGIFGKQSERMLY